MRSMKLVAAVAAGLFSFQAFAEDSKPVFSIQQTALQHTSNTSKIKPDGGATTTFKTTGTETTPVDSFLIFATFNNLAVYLYPTTPGAPVGVGYYLNDDLEIGANFSLVSEKKDKDKSTEVGFGPYISYYVPLAEDSTLELGFAPTFYSATKEQEVDQGGVMTKQKTRTTGLDTFVGATAFFPLTKNFLYGAGLSVNVSSRNEKDAKIKTTSTDVNLNLATFRFNF